MAKKDVVFVIFGLNVASGMSVLEWIFDHFEIEEISLVLTYLHSVPLEKTEFTQAVEKYYLPRCRKEKFEARILTLEQDEDAFLWELINNHGMTKLITSSGWIREVVEDYSTNFSCRIRGIHANRKSLIFIRDDESVGEMDKMEYLPNTQTSKQHPLKKNKVFVALDFDIPGGEKVLDWVFQNFEKEKTKLVVTTLYTEEDYGTVFVEAAQRSYLRRCQIKEFEAEMLVPRAKKAEDTTLELITEHGMERLVLSTLWLCYVLESLGTIPYKPCMIWTFHRYNGKLLHFRGAREIRLLQTENDLHQEKIERHHLTKEYEQLIIEKPQSKEKIVEISQKLQAVKKRIIDLQGGKDPLGLSQSPNNITQEEQNLQIALRRVEYERNMLREEQNSASQEIHELKERLESLQIERNNIAREAETPHKGRNRSEFTLQELEHATQNFSDSLILGKGAFGCVYKGYLRGTIVAVKILNSQSTEGVKAFKREVDILTSVRHPNLVTLMGACYEVSALVYEFLPNGSLEDHLNHKNNTSLTWKVRTSILAEICLALIFLHSSKPNMVIHGDLKPDNVLLDANFVSKLGDFGISHLIERTDVTSLCETYTIMGTFGYMDPEFASTGELTEKSDVFALGVIILRLITGQPTIGIVSKVRETVKNKTLHEIIDKSAGNWPFDHVEELTMLGLRCVQLSRSDRPQLFNDVWPIVEKLHRR